MVDDGHVHVYHVRDRRFVDFCHYVEVRHPCADVECDHVHVVLSARSFHLNPAQLGFARPECPECRAAVKGIEPASWRVRA
jgi:hypothetical protein